MKRYYVLSAIVLAICWPWAPSAIKETRRADRRMVNYFDKLNRYRRI